MTAGTNEPERYYNSAYLDEQTKRMIRRAILKAIAIPGYQVPFAAAVRSRAGIATSAVGMIYSPDMAEQIVANGQADMVSLGRAMLIDPYWPQRAAKVLRAEVNWPAQYERGDIY